MFINFGCTRMLAHVTRWQTSSDLPLSFCCRMKTRVKLREHRELWNIRCRVCLFVRPLALGSQRIFRSIHVSFPLLLMELQAVWFAVDVLDEQTPSVVEWLLGDKIMNLRECAGSAFFETLNGFIFLRYVCVCTSTYV